MQKPKKSPFRSSARPLLASSAEGTQVWTLTDEFGAEILRDIAGSPAAAEHAIAKAITVLRGDVNE